MRRFGVGLSLLLCMTLAWADPADGTLSSGSGVVHGEMEIPDYAFDADIDVAVQGDQVRLKVTVLDETVEDTVISLQDYFGSAPAETP